MIHVKWLAKTNFCFQNELKIASNDIFMNLKNVNNGPINYGNISVAMNVKEQYFETVAEQIKTSLLIIGLKNGNGIHLGSIGGKAYINTDFLKEMAKKAGINAIRNLHYGLNVANDYAEGDRWVFIESPSAYVSVNETKIVDDIQKILSSLAALGEELQNALEIWNLSRFYPNSMGRYLLNICAIECVVEHCCVCQEILSWLDKSIYDFDKIKCNGEDKKIFRQRLEYLRQDSISSAGRHLFRRVFPNGIDGIESGKYFNDIYSIRSQMVHSGKYNQQVVPENFESTISELLKILVKEKVREVEFA